MHFKNDLMVNIFAIKYSVSEKMQSKIKCQAIFFNYNSLINRNLIV